MQRSFGWLLYAAMTKVHGGDRAPVLAERRRQQAPAPEQPDMSLVCEALVEWGRVGFPERVYELCEQSVLAHLLLREPATASEAVLQWCRAAREHTLLAAWPVQQRRAFERMFGDPLRRQPHPESSDRVSGAYRALWMCVLRQLDDPGDVCRARSVCSSWRNTVDTDLTAWAMRLERRFFCTADEGTSPLLQYMLRTPSALTTSIGSRGSAAATHFVLRFWQREPLRFPKLAEMAMDATCQWCCQRGLRVWARTGDRYPSRSTGNGVWLVRHMEFSCSRCGFFTEYFTGTHHGSGFGYWK